MKRKLTFLLAVILSTYVAQAQDLPVNSESNLVSISNVIIVDTISKASLKQRVEEWFSLNSNAHQTLMNVERSKKKKKKDNVKSLPAFTSDKKLNTDEKVIYTVMIDNTNKLNPYFKETAKIGTPPEYTTCNLIFLFKDGKMKYEFTNFAHFSLDNDHSGGKYENDKPDAYRKYMKKSYWLDLRKQTIEKVRLIAGNMEDYIKHPVNTEMNF